MPVVYRDMIRGEPTLGPAIPSSRSDVLTEQFAQTFEENPIKATSRFFALRDDERTGPMLDAASARQKLKDAGLEAHLKVNDAGITQAALDTLMERKRTELKRQEVFSRAQGGPVEFGERLGLSVATTLADPISAGLNFVPVVGQVRYARWLAEAGSIAGRIGIRAGVGALEGATGAALQEPFIYGMRTQEQADYSSTDSLLNVALGGITGAGLHASIGSATEGIDALRQGLGWPASITRAPGLSSADRLAEYRMGKDIARNVDAAMEKYASLEGSEGGKVLNTDLARELSPEYRADRTRSAAVHEPTSWLVKRMYEKKLAEAPKDGEDAVVVFSAGGTGAGKTTGLETLARSDPNISRAQIIYDTNFNRLKSAVDKIEQALAANKEVRVIYTWRDPVESLTEGALPRAMRTGRTVPLNEHLNTHVGAAKTVPELMTKYKDDPRVQFDIIDNSRGRGAQELGSLETIRPLEYDQVREDLRTALEAKRASGAISEAVYRGTAGPASPGVRSGDRRQSAPQDREALSADERAALASPDVRQAALRAAVGQAVEGRPINVEGIFDPQSFVKNATQSQADPAHLRASQAADETIEREPVMGSTEERLKAAEEDAALAVADAKASAKRLGQEYTEDEALTENLAKAERWARIAELATVCLTR